MLMFPSPRGVELHKPRQGKRMAVNYSVKFPSPRGVELHKPYIDATEKITQLNRFRPLAGLSCINLGVESGESTCG